MIQLKSQIKKFGLIFVAMLIGAFQSQAAKTHLNMGMVLEPPHLDPTAGAAAAIDEVVYANVFEGLTRINVMVKFYLPSQSPGRFPRMA